MPDALTPEERAHLGGTGGDQGMTPAEVELWAVRSRLARTEAEVASLRDELKATTRAWRDRMARVDELTLENRRLRAALEAALEVGP